MAPLVLAALLAAGPAAAGSGCSGSAEAAVQQIFEEADADASGALTRAEYESANLVRFGTAFEATDSNADGETTLSEYLAHYEAHHPAEDETDI
jgi:hypothetical protein